MIKFVRCTNTPCARSLDVRQHGKEQTLRIKFWVELEDGKALCPECADQISDDKYRANIGDFDGC